MTDKTPNPCKPRRRFTTEQAAHAASINIYQRQGVRRYVVPCKKCNGWHLEQA